MFNCGYVRKKSQPLLADLRRGSFATRPENRPPCNAKDPFSSPENAKLYMKAPAQTKAISLQITWRDGTQSEVSRIERN